MIRQLNYAWFLALLLLAACAGLTKPETINQRIAYSEASLTAVYQTIGSLKTSGRIDAAKRDSLVSEADKVGIALDTARGALAQGLPNDALGRLQAAQSALIALQKVLQEYER